MSSAKVVEIAERCAEDGRHLFGTEQELHWLRQMINGNAGDLMREFSIACREELETLRTWQRGRRGAPL